MHCLSTMKRLNSPEGLKKRALDTYVAKNTVLGTEYERRQLEAQFNDVVFTSRWGA